MDIKVGENCVFVATSSGSSNKEYLEFLYHPKIDSDSTIKILRGNEDYEEVLPIDGKFIFYKIELTESNKAQLYENGNLIPVGDIVERISLVNVSETPVFSICKIRNCLLELYRKSLYACKNGLCDSYSENTKNRDFLFISLYVLEELIANEQFEMAESILNKLYTCMPICESTVKSKSLCNCK